MRPFKHRSSPHRELLAAVLALMILGVLHASGTLAITMRANYAIGPAQSFYVPDGSMFVGEFLEELVGADVS